MSDLSLATIMLIFAVICGVYVIRIAGRPRYEMAYVYGFAIIGGAYVGLYYSPPFRQKPLVILLSLVLGIAATWIIRRVMYKRWLEGEAGL